MLKHLKILYAHRELLLIWTLREIRVRYKQSLLGASWAILQPLVLMLAFTVVFSVIIKMPSDGTPYPVFSYTALLAWTFFASSITFAIPTLINNLSLVTKVYFPREILPIASVFAAFVDFLVASVLLVGALVIYHVPVSLTVLWLPVLVLIQILLILGIVLPASALTVFYRDVRFIVPLGVQLWLYATPIIYPVSMVPEPFRLIYALNPMVGIVDSFRRVILQGVAPVPEYLAISAVMSIVLAFIGYTYFKRSEGSFADLI
jgi:homopolymeric O-antigen transport system permease protein